MSLPISPVQCEQCDVLFCKKCLTNHRDKSSYSNRDKCPQCKQVSKEKEINGNLKKITIDKLKFKHRCRKEPVKPALTAAELFK